jgi:hypothetical protein
MTAAEKDAFEALRGSDRLAKPWATGTSLAATDELWSFLQQIGAAHAVRMSGGVPVLHSLSTTGSALADDQVIALSPFTIARADELAPGATVTVLHVVNGRAEVVSSAIGTALAELAASPRSVRSLRDQIADPAGRELDALEHLRASGMLVVLRTEGAASPRAGDARPSDRTHELDAPSHPGTDGLGRLRRLPLIQ